MAIAAPKNPLKPGAEIKFDADAKARFCVHFAKTHLMTESAAVAGVDYTTVRMHLRRDPEFMLAVKAAKKEHLDSIEREIHRRGVVGWHDETVTFDQAGNERTKSKKYRASDELLKLYAKRHMKAYRNEGPNPALFQPTVNVNTQVNVNFDTLDADTRVKLRAFLEALRTAPAAAVLPATVPAIAPVIAATNGHENGDGKEIANGNGTH